MLIVVLPSPPAMLHHMSNRAKVLLIFLHHLVNRSAIALQNVKTPDYFGRNKLY